MYFDWSGDCQEKRGKEEGDDDTKLLTEKLLKKYPNKKWVIDGGSLQMMDLEIIPRSSILTPHKREFEMLFKSQIQNPKLQINSNDQIFEIQNEVYAMAKNINV